MGNSILKCFCGDSDDAQYRHQYRYSDFYVPQYSQNSGNQEVTQAASGLAALANDLLYFEIASQVPEGLSSYVDASEELQANWYQKLSAAWKEATPVPKTRVAAATLVARTLRRNRKEDIKGILDYYSLPPPLPLSPGSSSQFESSSSPAWPKGVKFELSIELVDENAVTDGDGITVYDDTPEDVPVEVKIAIAQRAIARAEKNYKRARELQLIIKKAGYRVVAGPNGKATLSQKHRIRLRGIDAPEGPQPFGKEAKEGLIKLTKGKSLKVHVYGTDQYGRLIGDVYCNGIFVQEYMLKRGLAMHYARYDKRPEFAKWEGQAKAARRGLWSLPNPEEPWEWRKRNKGWRGKNTSVQVS